MSVVMVENTNNQQSGQPKKSRVRINIDCDENLKKALAIYAGELSKRAKRKVGHSEAAEIILKDALAEELAQVEAEEGEAIVPPRRRPGRPPKS